MPEARKDYPVLSTPEPGRHIAPCGLYCSGCGKFKRGRCKGCQIEPGIRCCPVRACCAEKGITTCAACEDFAERDVRECKTLNSFIARAISFFTRSDRPGAITQLRDEGEEAYLAARSKDTADD